MTNLVNDQTVDAVSQVSTMLIGNSAPQAMGLLDVTGAESMGMSMHNAVSSQHNSQISSAAAVTAACAKMLQVNSEGTPAPEQEPKSTPPPFMPLGHDNKVSADTMLKQANTLAEAAAKMIQDSQVQQKNSQSESTADLNKLIATLQALEAASGDTKANQADPEKKPAQGSGSQT